MKALFTAPTAIRAIRREDPEGALIGDHDISSLQTLFLAGERLDPDTYHWATTVLGVPVVDNWWQTETGWPIAANPRGLEPLPLKEGSPSVAVPGYDVRVLDGEGNEVRAGHRGQHRRSGCRCRPGPCPTLWGDDERYVSSYLSAFPGYYTTGDGGYVDADGYLYVLGRTDDVINVAGHRLSTGVHGGGGRRAPGGRRVRRDRRRRRPQGPVAPRRSWCSRAVSRSTRTSSRRQIVADVREHVGPVAAFREVVIVPGLAQDPLRQDPAQDHARDRRRTTRAGPLDDRGRKRPRGPHPAAAEALGTGCVAPASWARRALTAPARCSVSTATSASASPASTAASARACSWAPRATLSLRANQSRAVHLRGVPQRGQDPLGPRCGPQDRPVEGAVRRGDGGRVGGVRPLGGDQPRVRRPHSSDVLGVTAGEGIDGRGRPR